MHDKVSIRDIGVDRFYPIDRQNIPRGRPRELVSAMTRATSNGERINVRISHKLSRLVGVCQHLVVRKLSRGTNAVLFTRFTRLKRPQTT